MLTHISRVAFVLISCLAGGAAIASSGTAVGVDPDAEVRGKQVRTLEVGSDIFIGDRVVTDANGLVQILFDDNTKLVVGPKSSLVIEDYLIREDGSAGKLAVNALSGTFRFITGNAKKSAYVIETPTGQIGVRGTMFDLYVTKLATYLLQLHGATINCPDSGECVLVDDVCEYAQMTGDEVETADRVAELDSATRKKANVWFQFSKAQGALLRPFRVSGAERCLKAATVDAGPPASLSDLPIKRPPRDTDDDEGDDFSDDDGPILKKPF